MVSMWQSRDLNLGSSDIGLHALTTESVRPLTAPLGPGNVCSTRQTCAGIYSKSEGEEAGGREKERGRERERGCCFQRQFHSFPRWLWRNNAEGWKWKNFVAVECDQAFFGARQKKTTANRIIWRCKWINTHRSTPNFWHVQNTPEMLPSLKLSGFKIRMAKIETILQKSI